MRKTFQFLCLLLCMLFSIPSHAQNVTYDGISYYLKDDGTAAVVGHGDDLSGAISIPPYITNDGMSYTVTSINNYAFKNCFLLTSVTIPNSVTKIDYGAFWYCGLTSVEIPGSVTEIGVEAFGGCSELKEIIVDDNNAEYTSIDGVLFNKNKDILIQYPAGKPNSTYSIPNHVKEIWYSAFRECQNLNSVIIPSSVTSICGYAFYRCLNMTSIDIPNSVTEIGFYAFNHCESLISVDIPNSVTVIEESTFRECLSLTSVTIPNSVTEIGDYVFSGCKSLEAVTIPNSVTEIGDYVFSGCKSLEAVTIPNSVTHISSRAFYECISLKSVEIPNSITEIEYETFCGCKSLTSIEIPNSVTKIDDRAFCGCENLTSVEIPNSVTTIGEEAFLYCLALKSITIPNSVTTIGNFAFYCGPDLTTVRCGALEPPSILDNTFTNKTYANGTLYVLEEAVEAYKSAEGWRNFSEIKGTYSGIKDIQNDNISIVEIDGGIAVDGAVTVNVYNAAGVQVYSGASGRIALPSGVYIVVADKVSKKVVL